ncbi:MAG: 2-amino-4-hydroxy-6-hydroxymethyldihydropteridine diphosphokinase [Clostridia bacterium]|nr:2-amino-4-hydroxy-6-hydroxymethyldihydropteridine diphosphokinase [Clostridia bacterium]
MVTAYVGLGSNQGDSPENIRQALRKLDCNPGVSVQEVAGLYKTAPVGYLEQDWFVNTVARIETSLSPDGLLKLLLTIEDELGRVRTIRWGPRTLDLDLLLYAGEVIDSPELTVPHPRMQERAFVMVPLAEIAPDLLIKGQRAEQIAKILKKNQEIVGTGQKVW